MKQNESGVCSNLGYTFRITCNQSVPENFLSLREFRKNSVKNKIVIRKKKLSLVVCSARIE